MARLSLAARLEQLGLARLADLARRARWHVDVIRWVWRPRTAASFTGAWLREPRGRRAYRVLSEEELRASRRSETVFVFGSGRSLLDIDEAAWERIGEHDVVAFSHFHRQRSVRVDYHLIAELLDLEGTAASIRDNPFYAETIFVVLKGWLALRSNQLVAGRLLPAGARLFRVRRVGRGEIRAPSSSFATGLAHGVNTSVDAVNFAYLMGWRRIVVVGVDLYNKEYFWLPPGTTTEAEAPGVTAESTFPGAEQTVETFRRWAEELRADGVALEVYDSRSLLARALPVFSRASE